MRMVSKVMLMLGFWHAGVRVCWCCGVPGLVVDPGSSRSNDDDDDDNDDDAAAAGVGVAVAVVVAVAV